MTWTPERSACVSGCLAQECLTPLVIQTSEIRGNPGSGAFADTVWMNSHLPGELPGGARRACRDLLAPRQVPEVAGWRAAGSSHTPVPASDCMVPRRCLKLVMFCHLLWSKPQLMQTGFKFHARVFPFSAWPLCQGWENHPRKMGCRLTILPANCCWRSAPLWSNMSPMEISMRKSWPSGAGPSAPRRRCEEVCAGQGSACWEQKLWGSKGACKALGAAGGAGVEV